MSRFRGFYAVGLSISSCIYLLTYNVLFFYIFFVCIRITYFVILLYFFSHILICSLWFLSTEYKIEIWGLFIHTEGKEAYQILSCYYYFFVFLFFFYFYFCYFFILYFFYFIFFLFIFILFYLIYRGCNLI